jgi:hypothetical protein
MPGFTAINAGASEAHAQYASATPAVDETAAARRKATKRRQLARKKPGASKDVDQIALDSNTRKPISGKGKKRASHPGDEPEPKRRKSGSMKSSMPTTKTVVSSTTTMDPGDATRTKIPSNSSTEAGSVSLTSMAKLNVFRYATRQAARSTEIEPQSIQSTSVYHTPETSMTNVSVSIDCMLETPCLESLPQYWHDLGVPHLVMRKTHLTDAPRSSNAHYLRLLCKPSETCRGTVRFCIRAPRPCRTLPSYRPLRHCRLVRHKYCRPLRMEWESQSRRWAQLLHLDLVRATTSR